VASRRLEEALEIARAISDPLLVAETLAELGEVHVRQGHSSEAQECWEEARRGFRDLHARLDADRLTTRIEALLDRARRAEWGTLDEEAS